MSGFSDGVRETVDFQRDELSMQGVSEAAIRAFSVSMICGRVTFDCLSRPLSPLREEIDELTSEQTSRCLLIAAGTAYLHDPGGPNADALIESFLRYLRRLDPEVAGDFANRWKQSLRGRKSKAPHEAWKQAASEMLAEGVKRHEIAQRISNDTSLNPKNRTPGQIRKVIKPVLDDSADQ